MNLKIFSGWLFANKFSIIIALTALSMQVYVSSTPPNSLLIWFNNDDGFYYFKVAQNIVAGRGVSFDGVNLTNGFHPLWMLVCMLVFAIFRSDLITPLRVVVVIFGFLQAVSLVLLFKLLRGKMNDLLASLVTICFGLSWHFYSTIFSGGLESALSFLFIVLLLLTGSRYKNSKMEPKLLWLTGLFAGLAIMSRLDNIIFVIFYGIWLVFDRSEDSNRLMLDAGAAMIIVVSAAMIRTGFSIFHLEKPLLAMAILFSIFGVTGNFLNGLFSHSIIKPVSNKILRVLLSWLITVIPVAALSYLLFVAGYTGGFPRGILAVASIGWLAFTTSRVYLNKRPVIPLQLSVWGSLAGLRNTSISWLKKPAAYFIPVIVLLGLYMGWNQVIFGTPMPVSGQIKHWWGTLGNTIYGSPIHSLSSLRKYLFSSDAPFAYLYTLLAPFFSSFGIQGVNTGIISWITVILSIVGLFLLRLKDQLKSFTDYLAIAPLAAGTLYRTMYFYISGYVHIRSWYWTVETLFLFLGLAAFTGTVWNLGKKNKLPRYLIIVVSTIALAGNLILAVQGLASTYPRTVTSELADSYLIIPRLVEAKTEPGDVIGTPGGGTLSYFIQDRVIVNLDGLMNSKVYFDDLRRFDTHEFMKKMGIKYIYANEYSILNSLPYSSIFKDRLTLVNPVFGKSLLLYK